MCNKATVLMPISTRLICKWKMAFTLKSLGCVRQAFHRPLSPIRLAFISSELLAASNQPTNKQKISDETLNWNDLSRFMVPIPGRFLIEIPFCDFMKPPRLCKRKITREVRGPFQSPSRVSIRKLAAFKGRFLEHNKWSGKNAF